MVLIIGGAWQGKRDFARKEFGLSDGDFFQCTGENVDFSKKCITELEEFVKANPDPVGYFETHRALWQDSIFICRDMFCGVVPLGAENRDWRQNAGRFFQYLAGQAERVSRIFCGLEQRLK